MNIATLFRRITGDRTEVKRSQVIVVCASHSLGVSAEEGFAIQDCCDAAPTLGWWFLNPGTFLVIFPSSDPERAAASALASALRAVPLVPEAVIGIGVVEGPLICELSRDGTLAGHPIGETITSAMQTAQGEAERLEAQQTRRADA